jgi:hypothetical protein
LRELEACHAVKSARFHLGGRYCLAEEGNLFFLSDDDASPSEVHLQRLHRTVSLMKEWLDSGRVPEEVEDSFSTKIFFDSYMDAENWFDQYCLVSYRTMQRDMRDVWTALRDY